MKKLLFFLFLVLTASTQAQTYKQSQELLSQETARLEKRLSQVKDSLYYLEVIVGGRINEISAQAKPSNAAKAELQKLKKLKYFFINDSVMFHEEKNNLETALRTLKRTDLLKTVYQAKKDSTSTIPERMSNYEYNQRLRSLAFKTLEKYSGESIETQGFEGLLVNYKIGRNEIINFIITRTDVAGFPVNSYSLEPQSNLFVKLLPGTYRIDVIYGSITGQKVVKVDPTKKDYVDKQWVYWFATAM